MEETDYLERLKSTGRNDTCPCGSGKKYKKCHLITDSAKRHEESVKQEEQRAAEAEEADEAEETQDEANAATKKKAAFNDRMSPGGINRAGKSHTSQNIPRRSAK
ncbi:MAG: hypothetical protein HN368_00755 [Spirochaetales bacterium]|nr:hypothetical protein [Spirochaetales bacterium]